MQVLLWAQLRGNNQSTIKIPAGAVARQPDAGPLGEPSGSGAVSLIDGNQGYGMVVLHRATEEAVSRAQQQGVGIVGTNNTSTSTGALGCFDLAFE